MKKRRSKIRTNLEEVKLDENKEEVKLENNESLNEDLK